MQCSNRSVMAGFLDRINRIYRIEFSWSFEFEFLVREVKVEGEGEQWKILVIAKVAVEGLTVLCQNFWWRSGGNVGFLVLLGIIS